MNKILLLYSNFQRMAGNGMKSLAKDTAIYGMSSIVGRFLNWMLVPLYTNVFTETGEYGVVSYIYAIVAFAFVILTYGMETTFFRFINKREENTNTVYSTTIISLASTSILFIVVCSLFITPISSAMGFANHSDFIMVMAIATAIDAFCAIPFAYLRYAKRPIRFAALKMAMIFFNIFLNLFLILWCPEIYKTHPSIIDWFYNPDYGVGYIFAANLITSACTLLLLIPDFTGFKYSFDKALLKRMLRYSSPLLILGLAGVMNQTVDKILYPLYIFPTEQEGLAQLGIYSACAKIAVVMTMFTQAFRYAYEPFIFAQNKQKGDNTQAYAMAMKYFIIFAFVIFLGVMFNLDILKYFVGKSYFAGITVVPILMLGEIFFGIYFNLSLWYKLIDKTHYGAIFSLVGCAVIVIINVIFVPKFGYIASAWASFFANLIMMLISYFIGQRFYPIKYDMKTIMLYTVLTILFYIPAMYVNIDNEWIRFLYRNILLIIFVTIIIKRDLPLSEIPIIGKWFSKKDHN